MGGSPSRARESPTAPLESSTVPVQSNAVQKPGRPSPQVGADPATPGPAARHRVATAASTSESLSALPAGDIRIFIHHVADRQSEKALAKRLADYLRRQGFTVAAIRPVDLNIREPSVRYFFARDRAASQRLVEELVRFSEEGTSVAPDHASDFTHFLPKPRPGNVEVWLPSQAVGAS
jgi:hypothetical protein